MKFFKSLARGHITRKQSFWLGSAILGIFFIISVIAIRSNHNTIGNLTNSSQPEPEPTLGFDGQAMNSGVVLKDFHRSEVKDGKTIWEIQGTSGKYIPEKNMAEILSPTLTVSRTADEHIVLVGKRALLYLSGTELSRAEIFDDIKLNYKNQVFVSVSSARLQNDIHVDLLLCHQAEHLEGHAGHIRNLQN